MTKNQGGEHGFVRLQHASNDQSGPLQGDIHTFDYVVQIQLHNLGITKSGEHGLVQIQCQLGDAATNVFQFLKHDVGYNHACNY